MASPANDSLTAAEAADGYRAACAASPANAYARRNCTYTPFFAEDTDVNRLVKLLDDIPLTRDTDVVVLHPTAENGYPHTRAPNLIAMPLPSVTGVSDEALAETLRHEAVHIHQRRQPKLWAAACVREGWWPLPAGQVPQRWRAQCRLNPDTFQPQQFWSWETHHVPLPLFSSEAPSNLADISVKWLDLRNGVLYPSPPPSFQARYGNAPSQPEHPFELLAVEAARDGLTTDRDLFLKLMGP